MPGRLIHRIGNSRHTNMILLALAIILTVGVALNLRIFFRGFVVGHDTDGHIRRLTEFDAGLRAGSLYPRWSANANLGFGSPSFIFYPPLFYYLTFGLYALTGSIEQTLMLASALSIVVSGLTMYIYMRSLTGPFPSLMAAVVYMALPYHIFDLYRRAALTELWAFVWVPIILLLVSRLGGVFRRDVAALSLSWAGLVLTHPPTAVLCAPFVGGYALWRAWKDRSTRVLSRLSVALGLGFGLSGIYLVPAAAEQRFVRMELLTDYPFRRLEDNFLFSSTGSLWLPFISRIAMVQLILFVVVCVALWGGYKSRRMGGGNGREWGEMCSFMVWGAFAYFLMIQPSMALWEAFPARRVVVLPWRLLLLVCLATSILVGYWAASFRQYSYWWRLGTAGLVGIALGINIFTTAWQVIQGSWHDRRTMAKLLAEGGGKLDLIEYTPIHAPLEEARVVQRAWFESGGGRLQVVNWSPEQRELAVHATIKSLLRIRTYYYPGWTAYLDGLRVATRRAIEGGEIEIEIPEGEHTVKLEFEDTWVRTLGKAVSGISGLLWLVAVGLRGKASAQLASYRGAKTNMLSAGV